MFPLALAIIAGLALFLFARKAIAEPAASSVTDVGPQDIIAPDNLANPPPVFEVNTLATTRGERNNNPLNIRYNATDQWQGLVGHDSDGFCIFQDVAHCFRAGGIIIRRYYNVYYLNTIRGIITRYAPPSENPTEAYIASVSTRMGIAPDANIDVINSNVMIALLSAMVWQENGENLYTNSDIGAGLALA